MAIIHEPLAVDRLVVSDSEVPVEPGPGSCQVPVDDNRFNPVDGVLEHQRPTEVSRVG